MDDLDLLLSSDEEEDIRTSRNSSRKYRKTPFSKSDSSKDFEEKNMKIISQQNQIDNLRRDMRARIWDLSKLEREKSEFEKKYDSLNRKMNSTMNNMEQKHKRELNSLQCRIDLLKRNSSNTDSKAPKSKSASVIQNVNVKKYEDVIRKMKRKIEILEIKNQKKNSHKLETEERIRSLEHEIYDLKLTFSSDRGLAEFINNEVEELSTVMRKRNNKKPTRKERLQTLLTREKRYKKMKKMIQKYSQDFLRHTEIVTALKAQIIDMQSNQRDMEKRREGDEIRNLNTKLARESRKVGTLQASLRTLSKEKKSLIEKHSRIKKTYDSLVEENKKIEEAKVKSKPTGQQVPMKKVQALMQKTKQMNIAKKRAESDLEERNKKLKVVNNENKELKTELTNLKLRANRERIVQEKMQSEITTLKREKSNLASQHKKLKSLFQGQIVTSKKQKDIIDNRRIKSEVILSKMKNESQKAQQASFVHLRKIDSLKKENKELVEQFETLMETKLEEKNEEIENLTLEYELQIQELNESHREKTEEFSTAKSKLEGKISKFEQQQQQQQQKEEEELSTKTKEVEMNRGSTFYNVLEREHEEMSVQLEQYEMEVERLKHVKREIDSVNEENKILKATVEKLKRTEIGMKDLGKNNSRLQNELSESRSKIQELESVSRKLKLLVQTEASKRDSHHSKISKMKETNESMINEKMKEIQNLQARIGIGKEEMENLKRAHEKAISALKSSHEEMIRKLKGKQAEMGKQNDSLRKRMKSTESRVGEISEISGKQIEVLKKTLHEEHEKKIKEVKVKYNNLYKSAKKKLEGRIEIMAKEITQKDELLKKSQAQLTLSHRNHKAVTEKQTNETVKVNQENLELKAKQNELVTFIKKKEGVLNTLKTEKTSLLKKVVSLESQVNAIRNKYTNLENLKEKENEKSETKLKDFITQTKSRILSLNKQKEEEIEKLKQNAILASKDHEKKVMEVKMKYNLLFKNRKSQIEEKNTEISKKMNEMEEMVKVLEYSSQQKSTEIASNVKLIGELYRQIKELEQSVSSWSMKFHQIELTSKQHGSKLTSQIEALQAKNEEIGRKKEQELKYYNTRLKDLGELEKKLILKEKKIELAMEDKNGELEKAGSEIEDLGMKLKQAELVHETALKRETDLMERRDALSKRIKSLELMLSKEKLARDKEVEKTNKISDKLGSTKREYMAEKKSLQASFAREKENLQRNFGREIAEMKGKFENRLEQLQASHRSELLGKAKEVELGKADMEKLKKDNEKKVQDVKVRYNTLFKNAKNQLEGELEDLKRTHKLAMGKLKLRTDESISGLSADKESLMRELEKVSQENTRRAKLIEDMEVTRRKMAVLHDKELQDRKISLENKYSNEISYWKKELDLRISKIEQLSSRISELSSSLKTSRGQEAEMGRKMKHLQFDIEDSQEKNLMLESSNHDLEKEKMKIMESFQQERISIQNQISSMNENNRKEIEDVKSKCDEEINAHKNEVSELSTKLKHQEDEYSNLESEKLRMITKLEKENQEQKIFLENKFRNEYHFDGSEKVRITEENERMKFQIDELTTKIEELEMTSSELGSMLENKEKAIAQKDSEIGNFKFDIEELQERTLELETVVNEKNDRISELMTKNEELRGSMQLEKEDYMRELAKSENTAKGLSKALASEKTKNAEYQQKLMMMKDTIGSQLKSITELKSTIDENESKYKKLTGQRRNEYMEVVKEKESSIDTLKSNLHELKVKIHRSNSLVIEKVSLIGKMKTEKEDIVSRNTEQLKRLEMIRKRTEEHHMKELLSKDRELEMLNYKLNQKTLEHERIINDVKDNYKNLYVNAKSKLEDRIRDFSNRLSVKVEEINDRLKEIRKLRKKLKELQSQNRKKDENIARKERDLTKKDEIISILSQEKSSLEKNNRLLGKKIEEKEKLVASLNSQLSETKWKFSSSSEVTKRLQSELADVKLQLASQKDQGRILEGELSVSQQEAKVLRDEIDELKELGIDEEDIVRNHMAIAKVQKERDALTYELGGLKKDLGGLQVKHDLLKSTHNLVVEDGARRVEEIGVLQSRIQEGEDIISKLRSELDESQNSVKMKLEELRILKIANDDEKTKLKNRHKNERSKLMSSLDEEKTKLLNSFQEEKKHLQQARTSEKNQLETSMKDTLSRQKEIYLRKLEKIISEKNMVESDLRKRVTEYENSVSKLNMANQKKIESVNKKFLEEKQQLVERQKKMIKKLQIAQSTTVDQKMMEMFSKEKEISRLKEAHEQRVVELTKENEKKVKAVKVKYNQLYQTVKLKLESELESLRTRLREKEETIKFLEDDKVKCAEDFEKQLHDQERSIKNKHLNESQRMESVHLENQKKLKEEFEVLKASCSSDVLTVQQKKTLLEREKERMRISLEEVKKKLAVQVAKEERLIHTHETKMKSQLHNFHNLKQKYEILIRSSNGEKDELNKKILSLTREIEQVQAKTQKSVMDVKKKYNELYIAAKQKLEGYNIELSRKLKTSEDSQSELKKLLEKSEKEISDTKLGLSRTEGRLKTLQQKTKNALTVQLRKVKGLELEKLELKKKLEVLETSSKMERLNKNQKLNKSISENERKIEEVKKMYNNLYKNAKSKLEGRISELNDSIHAKDEEMKEMNMKIFDLNSTLKKNESFITKLKVEKSATQKSVDHFKMESKVLKSKNSTLTEETVIQKRRISKYMSQINEKDNTLKSLRSEVEIRDATNETEKSELVLKISKLTSEMQSAREVASRKEKKLSQIQLELKNKTKEIQEYHEKTKHLEEENKTFVRDLESVKNILKQKTKDLEHAISSKTQNERIVTEKEALVSELTSEKNNLLKSHAQEMSILKEEHRNLKYRHEKLQEELEESSSKFEIINHEKSILVHSLAEKESLLSKKKNEFQEMEVNHQQDIDHILLETYTKEKEIQTHKERQKHLTEEIEAVNRLLGDFEDEEKKLTGEIEKERKKHMMLHHELTEIKSSLKSLLPEDENREEESLMIINHLSRYMEAMKEDLSGHHKSCKALEIKISQVKEEKQKMVDELGHTQNENLRLREHQEELEGKLSDLQTQVEKSKMERTNLIGKCQNKIKRLQISHSHQLDQKLMELFSKDKVIETLKEKVETSEKEVASTIRKYNGLYKSAKAKLNEEIRALKETWDTDVRNFEDQKTGLENRRQSDIKLLKKKIDEISEGKKKVELEISTLQTSFEESQKKLFEEEKKGSSHARLIEKQKSDINKLLSTHETEKKKLSEQIRKLNLEVINKKKNITDLKSSMDTKIKDHETSVLEVKKKYNNLYLNAKTNLEKKASALQTEISQKTEENIGLRKKVKAKTEEFEVLRSQKKDMETKLQLELENVRRSMTNKIHNEKTLYENQIEEKNERIDALTSELSDLEVNLSELSKSMESAMSKEETMASKLRTIEGRMMDEETKYEDQIRDLKKLNTSFTTETRILRDDNEKLALSLEEMKSNHANLSRTHDTMVFQTSDLRREIERLKSVLAGKGTEIRSLEEKSVEQTFSQERLGKERLDRLRTKYEAEIEAKDAEMGKLKNVLDEVRRQGIISEERIKGLKTRVDQFEEDKRQSEEKMKSMGISQQRKIDQKLMEIFSKEKRIEELEKSIRNLSEEHDKKLQDVKVRYNTMYMAKKTELEDNIKEVTKNVKSNLTRLQGEMDDNKRASSEKEDQMTKRHESDLKLCHEKIQRLKKSNATLESDRKELRLKIEKLETQSDNGRKKLKNLEAKVKELSEAYKSQDETIQKQKSEIREKDEMMEDLKSAMDEVTRKYDLLDYENEKKLQHLRESEESKYTQYCSVKDMEIDGLRKNQTEENEENEKKFLEIKRKYNQLLISKNSEYEEKIGTLNTRIESLTHEMNVKNKHIGDLKVEKLETTRKLKQSQSTNKNDTTTIESLKKREQNLTSQLTKLRQQKTEADAKIKSLEEFTIKNLKHDLHQHQTERLESETQKTTEIKNKNEEIRVLRDEITRHEKSTQIMISKHQKEVASIKIEYNRLYKSKKHEMELRLGETSKQSSNQQQKLSSMTHEIKILRQSIGQKTEEINTLKSEKLNMTKVFLDGKKNIMLSHEDETKGLKAKITASKEREEQNEMYLQNLNTSLDEKDMKLENFERAVSEMRSENEHLKNKNREMRNLVRKKDEVEHLNREMKERCANLIEEKNEKSLMIERLQTSNMEDTELIHKLEEKIEHQQRKFEEERNHMRSGYIKSKALKERENVEIRETHNKRIRALKSELEGIRSEMARRTLDLEEENRVRKEKIETLESIQHEVRDRNMKLEEELKEAKNEKYEEGLKQQQHLQVLEEEMNETMENRVQQKHELVMSLEKKLVGLRLEKDDICRKYEKIEKLRETERLSSEVEKKELERRMEMSSTKINQKMQQQQEEFEKKMNKINNENEQNILKLRSSMENMKTSIDELVSKKNELETLIEEKDKIIEEITGQASLAKDEKKKQDQKSEELLAELRNSLEDKGRRIGEQEVEISELNKKRVLDEKNHRKKLDSQKVEEEERIILLVKEYKKQLELQESEIRRLVNRNEAVIKELEDKSEIQNWVRNVLSRVCENVE